MSLIMDIEALRNDPHAALALLEEQANALEEKDKQLSLKDKQLEEQAHSVLQVKAEHDKLKEKNTELELRVDKLLQQLFGRKSERRTDGEGQLYLDLGEEATPEVVNALEEAIREAEEVVDQAEAKENGEPKPPRKTDRKLPEHLPRSERVVDLPEDRREGLKFIGYDEVERLVWQRAELRVEVVKYAKYAHPADPSQGVLSPPRETGLVEGDRFDVSVAVEAVAWKYFYHLPFYRQQDLFAGSGWTPSRSILVNCYRPRSGRRRRRFWAGVRS